MAEKVIYEMGLVGVESVVSKIAQVNAAFSNISTGNLSLLGDALDSITGKAIRAARELGKVGKAQKGEVHFLSNFLTGDFHGKYQNMVDRARRKSGLAEINALRQRNREAGAFFGYGKGGMRRMLDETFGVSEQLKLPYYSFLQDIKSETSPVAELVRQRHNFAEQMRRQMRHAMSKVYPIVPVGDRSVVPRGTTALATLNEKHKYDIVSTGRDTSYIDADYRTILPDEDIGYKPKPPSFFEQMRDAFYKSNSPRSLFKNLSGMTGAAGTIGKIGMWGMAFNLVMSSIAWFGRNLKRLVDAVKNFGEVILQATESWRQLRESHFYGTSMGSLAGQWKAMTFLGGDAASASALWDRLSTDRAMLAYGGNGGRMMEAARLFGVGILGSGEYGYATNDEFMRNVAIEMSKSSKSRQKALANVLGLDPYQFWAVSNGVDYYDYVANRRTLRGMLRESLYNDSDVGKEIFSEESVTAAREFEGAWGEFVVSLKELGGELGEAILPLLSILLDTLNGIVQFISLILDPITKFLNWFFNLFSVRHWAEMDAINDTPTSAQISARTQAIGASGGEERNVIINMGDISLSNLGLGDDATPEEISDAVANRIFNRLGNHLINGRR